MAHVSRVVYVRYSVNANSEAWQKRYGTESAINPALEGFLNHRTVRRYSDEPIPEETVAQLVAAAQSAATSSNLQSWSIISIQDPELRQRIAALCGNQKQILTAPWFFVFLADLHRIDTYARKAGVAPDALDTVEMFTVATIDAALAAERMVCAAEALDMGICYIGALRNQPLEVQSLLHSPPLTFGLFGLCVGYPAASAGAEVKPRLGQDQVWFRDRYASELSSDEYDARVGEFFAEQGMPNDATWAAKSGNRGSIGGLSGRERLMEFLRAQGLNLR
jgi:nitroreductase